MKSTTERWREILDRQRVLPAPMCNISDHPFRMICRERGGPMAYTQMVSAEGIMRNDGKTLEILDLQGDEPLIGMQLFGCDPEKLASSARLLEELGATVVDLNMGCPAKKVTGTNGGSALLRQPDLVRRIVVAMRAALSVPFTIKMRWDWNDDDGAALGIARMAEAEGVDGLCLHARTRDEGYSGSADWNRIRQLKESVSIPVLGNGDVRRPQDAVEMMRTTGCDGVMIGRAAIGDPWLLGRALAAVERGEAPSAEDEPDWETRRATILDHARRMVESRGEQRGLTQFRKHAVAYIRGLTGARLMRPDLMKAANLDELAAILDRPRCEMDESDEGSDFAVQTP